MVYDNTLPLALICEIINMSSILKTNNSVRRKNLLFKYKAINLPMKR